MNAIGLILLGAAARATVLAVLGLGAWAVLRRWGPAARALAGSTTLAVMLGVAVLACSPWPHWWSPTDRAWEPRAVATDPSPTLDREVTPPRTADTLVRLPTLRLTIEEGWGTFVQEFGQALARPKADLATGAPWGWPAWVACLFLGGLAFALIRLGVGLGAVRALAASGRAVEDPSLLALVAELRRDLGLRRPVSLRETAALATPALVGWRRPVILLPPTWRDWTADERQAVLAHELAHIVRGDYLAGLAAQISLALHFYHPLAHVLARRLRLDQELAADARGATLAGGRRAYLRTLANLALRHDEPPPAWPARPFLPTRGTFLRRIEMLRDPRFVDQPPLLPRGRAALITTLAVVGLLVAGLRGPGGIDQAQAQSQAPPQGPVVAPLPAPMIDPLTLSSEVHMVLDFRPTSLLKNPDFRKLADQIPADGAKEFKAIASGQIDQVLVLGLDDVPPGVPGPANAPPTAAFVVRATQPYDWTNFISAPVDKVEVGGGTSYLKSRRGFNPNCYVELNDRTLLICPEPWVRQLPINPQQANDHGWDEAWKKMGPGTLRLAVDTPWLARLVQPAGSSMGGTMVQLVGPLLNQTQAYAATLDAEAGLTLDALAISATPAEAQGVVATLQALVTLGRNAMPALREQAKKGPPDAGRTLIDATAALDAMLASAKVEQDGGVARLHAQTDSVAPITALLAPAVSASRESANRTISVNNLKQIALAMHNFAATQPETSFPPAVLYGPDGKTPYSWRVALLPYLGQQTLYNEYKFDEPWDGPTNRKLIERMPDVFQDPSDLAAGKGETSYFVPTGPRTIFPDRKEGMKLQEITDGTSNTILVVESRRPIAWTDPRDIAIPAEGVLPALGGNHPGGFNASFADGAVRFIKQSIHPMVLQALFTAAGGEVVNLDALKTP